jgi:CheY-like chemotaxis protein
MSEQHIYTTARPGRKPDALPSPAAGFNAHLPKPVEPAELVITVGSFATLIEGKKL